MRTNSLGFAVSGLFACMPVFVAIALVEPQSVTPDLAGAPAERGWKLINRAAGVIDKNGGTALRLTGGGGQGYVRLEGFEFGDGMIECDLRGRNVTQQSFLGIAFHGSDANTYDAVYFRPFNFKPADAVRRTRAVQYVSHPAHTWSKLREQFPAKYEKAVTPAPDPDGWFHVRIVIAWPNVSVFVNDASEPCLVVEQLSSRKRGWVALWTDVSGGDFANLKVAPAGNVVSE